MSENDKMNELEGLLFIYFSSLSIISSFYLHQNYKVVETRQYIYFEAAFIIYFKHQSVPDLV